MTRSEIALALGWPANAAGYDDPDDLINRIERIVTTAVNAEREAILRLIPGGDICDPQVIADAIREME